MATQITKTIFQLRRATTAEWITYKDIIPAAGEPCFDIDLGVLKIGNGVDTYENLKQINGEGFEIVADGKSIGLDNSVLKLIGFDDATPGTQPMKNMAGKIEWVAPATSSDIDNLKTRVSTLEGNYTTVLNAVGEIENKVNGTGNGTIDDIVDKKITSYCMSNVVCGITVNGTTLNAVDGVVDISIPNQTLNVKESEEITIADDGMLGVGKINISKIYQDENYSIILDCNG